ncbi:ferritin-like domain-containing protein [Ampullimonas aquatilis]|uniref:ferritin-like domain-containing protein n=1 Tax=Ampullimonas aquatilis TaxID=1341549 RepID=UPI003C727CB8
MVDEHALKADRVAPIEDIQLIRTRARKDIESGPVTRSYAANVKEVVQLLNGALATELVCVLRYRRHYYVAKGIKAQVAAAEFIEHADEELSHAYLLAERIVQLGGEPDFNPVGLAERSHAEYFAGIALQDMIKENLIAERIAIDSYRQMVQYIGEEDPSTRRLLEEILAKEEEHSDDLIDLLEV